MINLPPVSIFPLRTGIFFEEVNGARSLKLDSRRKQPTFYDATTGFPRKVVWETVTEIPYWWFVASDWLKQIFHAHDRRSIRSTIQIWVVTRHSYGISAPVPQKSFSHARNLTSELSILSFLSSYSLIYFCFLVTDIIHLVTPRHSFKEWSNTILKFPRSLV